MNDRIAERTRAAALYAAPGVIFLYLALAGIHGLFAPMHGSRQVAMVLACGAIITSATYAWVRSTDTGNPALPITGISLVAVGVSLAFMALNGDPAQTVVTIITILAASYFLVWRWSTGVVVGFAFVGWFWLMPRSDAEVWIHWFINMSSACLMAVLVAEARARVLRELAQQTERAEAASQAQRSMADNLADQNVALEEARDLAVRSNADKDDLIANMSHEVRTPLQGVVGMLSLMEGTELNPKQRHYLDTARTSGETLMRLINDMLDFSAMEARKMKLDRREFVLLDIVESSMEILALDAKRKNIALACVADPGLPVRVFGDPERIQQALTNLLSNAVKHTVDGEIVVHVRKDLGRDRRAVIKLSVTDSGSGIPAKDHARVFDSFFRSGDKQTADGTGLGLTITKQLVELMDGNIGFSSSEEMGSSFWFDFPLEEGGPADGERSREAEALRGARIFVVEPESAYQQQLDSILLGWGIDADIFDDVHSALTHIEDSDIPPKFGIISTKAGRNPAYKIAEKLRASMGYATPRLTLLLEIGETVNSEDLDAAGYSSALSKPIRSVDLLKSLTTSSWSGMFRATSRQHTPPVREGNNKILVADDNPVGQTVATANLKALGYRVQVVSDGAQAIKAIAEEQFAAVLMDCQMPVLDGLEATREIRKWERKQGRTSIPIIAVTASAMRSDREASHRAGMSGHLSKPYTLQDLDAVLHQWLEERQSDNPPLKPSIPPAPAGIPVVRSPGRATDVFDPTILDQLKAVNPAAARATVKAFLHHTPLRLARLWAHIDRREAGDAANLAHQVKGSAAQLGAVQISSLAAKIERHYLDDIKGFPDVTVTQLEAAYSRLELEISPYQ